MGDLLTNGASWLASKLKADVSRLVRISRGTEQIDVYASIGDTEFQIDEDEGIRIEHSDRDFIVTAADYVFGGQVVVPQAGDLIIDTVEAASGESTFQVMHPTGGRPYRYDGSGNLLRIHTKRTTTDPSLA